MTHHAFNVAEVFAISGRGVVVVTDKTYEQLGKNIAVKVGDPVEFRRGNQVLLRSKVNGIEHSSPWSPQHPFAFLLLPDVNKDDVAIGSGVWLDECTNRT